MRACACAYAYACVSNVTLQSVVRILCARVHMCLIAVSLVSTSIENDNRVDIVYCVFAQFLLSFCNLILEIHRMKMRQ